MAKLMIRPTLSPPGLSTLPRRVVLILAVIIFCLSNGASVTALKSEQKRVIYSGSDYFNVEETHCVSVKSVTLGGGGSGGTIYVLGDSLTVGMRNSGLEEKLQSAGWQPTKINAIGGKNLGWGLEQVQADESIIQGSDSILIGLGTNNVADVVRGSTEVVGGKDSVKSKVQAIIDAVKSANANIKIYWTNVYVTGSLTTEFGTFDLDVARPLLNAAIGEATTQSGIPVIPWGTSTEAPQLLSSDGIHPSQYTPMVAYIVNQLGNSGAPPAQLGTCSCTVSKTPLVGSDNQQKAFNYFVGKGYKPEWAAGIVGNMINESSVEPMRLQGTASGVETPSSTLEASGNLNKTSIGWGLVQWTPPSKLVTSSKEAGIPFEEIDTIAYQLEFVWKQLEGTAVGSNEKNAGDKLKEAITPEDAAVAFGRYYERFQDSGDLTNARYTARKESARDVFDIYASGSPGPVGASGSCSGGTAGVNGWDLPGEGTNPMVYYSQRKLGDDPAVQGYYGDYSYGPGPISACGCGPTSWAMIVSTLTGSKVTPDAVATWAHDTGQQQPTKPEFLCGGSFWWWASPSTGYEEKWGVTASLITIDMAPAALRSGALILVSSSVNATGVDSPFTQGGHLLVMRAVTDDGKFLFADPNDHDDPSPAAQAAFGGKSKSRTPLSAEQFMPSTQGLWAISKKVTP
ncbi:hypothetical protein BH10PAT3_BH10PAT3_1780 [soil metagenome]